jgi:hypothetical protein
MEKRFSAAVEEALRKEPPEILRTVKDCTDGGLWIVGGFVYRSIAEELYGVPRSAKDIDFATDQLCNLSPPPPWTVTMNVFGQPKLSLGKHRIDIMDLPGAHYIRRKGLAPTIENLLAGSPLTIQAIAYDIHTGQVIGEAGKEALLTKTVRVHNRDQATFVQPFLGITTETLIYRKASSLGFHAIYD